MKLKNLIPKISLILLLTIAAISPCFSQKSDSKVVRTDETVSFLIEQNKNSRELIASQDARIKDLETELAAEKENSSSLGKSYAGAQSEIDALKRSNAALERAVAMNESTIELLKTEVDNQRAKVKKANKEKVKAYIIAAGAIALKFLL